MFLYPCTLSIKGTVSRLCARASVIFFFFKRQQNCHIYSTRFAGPGRTADGDLLCTFSSNVLDFQRSFSSYLKFVSRHEDSSRFCRQQGRLATQKSLSARFENSFSNVKLVSEVNCFKSSNICLICSRSSLKRLKDINKNSISMRRIIARVSQKLYHDFIATVFLNVYRLFL